MEEKITKENLYTGFRVLFKYLGQYKKTIISLSVIGIISALGNGLIPYIAGRFFDAILSTETSSLFGVDMPLFAMLLIIWGVIQLITYILDWRISITSEYLSNTIWLDYLSRGFGFILQLPMSFHKQNKIGEIGNKINMAGGSLETIAGRIVIDLAPQFLSIIVALIVSFYINQLLTLVLCIGLAVYIFALSRSVKPLGVYHKDYYDTVSKGFGDAYDAIGNTAAIKQVTAEQYEFKRITTVMKSAVPKWMKLNRVWSNLTLFQRLTILTTQLTIFALSIFYIRDGQMTLGGLLAFNSYAALIFGPFATIARNWQTIHNGIINIQETEKILGTPTENYSPTGSDPKKNIEGKIEFKNVEFRYEDGKHVLDKVSFTANPGEIIALVGESGVGKSTLIDLIGGYHFPALGELLIDGTPIQKIDLLKYRSQMAIVPQEVVLFNDTIKTNIRYGNFDSTDEQIEEAARKAYALDFIQKFPEKWNQLVGERGVKLSVGQKQRVAIARAILRSPRILILDEPTSALDASSERNITESLEELMLGKTTFIIAHRLSTVRKAHKILVFKEGKIIESGTHDELVTKEGGEYRRLYELQIGLHG